MEETRFQKTMKYKRNLSMKLLFPQKDENALMTLLHSVNDIKIIIIIIIIKPYLKVH